MHYKKILSCFLLITILAALYTVYSQTKNSVIPAEATKQIAIYISGNVVRPGQYEVPAGSTINQAVALAGGLLPDADTSKLKPNEPIESPLYIHIPSKSFPLADASTSQTRTNIFPANSSPEYSASADSHKNQMSALETQMFEWVNYERTSLGLQPLSPDMELVRAARLKSRDLIDNNYFDHQSPRYGSPADLLLSQGIKFKRAGENLAKVGTLERGHTGLMNSASHRENILRPEFVKIGIGIIDRGRQGLMITQEFTD